MILTDKIRDNKIAVIEQVNNLAIDLGINPDWLMFVIYFESGWNPHAKNVYSGATGLIQFTPNTAHALGTSVEELAMMDSLEQMTYVRKYFKPYAHKMQSLEDVYLAVFFPEAIGKADDYVLQTKTISAEKIASQNKIFDLDSDLRVTKGEVMQYLSNWINKNKINLYMEEKMRNTFAYGGLIILVFALMIIGK